MIRLAWLFVTKTQHNQTMKKGLILTLLLVCSSIVLGVLLFGCKKNRLGPKDTCEGTDSNKRYYYKFSSFIAKRYVLPQTPWDYALPLRYDSLRFHIFARTESFTVYQESRPSFSLFPEAYACTPAIYPYHSIERIDILSTSKTTYLHQKDTLFIGDTLSSRFLFKNDYETTFLDHDEFYRQTASDLTRREAFDVRLKDKPYQSTSVKFDIVIKTSDGTVFKVPTDGLNVY